MESWVIPAANGFQRRLEPTFRDVKIQFAGKLYSIPQRESRIKFEVSVHVRYDPLGLRQPIGQHQRPFRAAYEFL